MNLGRLDEAIECYRKVIALEPRLWQAHSNLLQALLYHHGSEPAEIFREHLAWAARHAQPTDGGQARPCIQSKIQNPKSRIKIGYVSPDLRLHAVGFFIEPILQHHDHEQFEIYAYADVPRPDVVTARLQKCCDQWLSVVGMSDEQVIRQIQEDQIDILVDLAGHTADNRMRLFAAKPAPIQVTYLGYQATTGLSTMDWRITDAHADPPGLTEAYHTERLYRLPRVFACYRPPENCPEVGPLPALSSGHVTFVSFSRLSKITPPAMDLWAKILQEVPSSRLTILSRGLHDAAAQKRLRECFVSRGLAPERLGLLGERNFAEYLQFHNEVDLALDTFPFTGHTTTCHGLWMGLPIVTLAGQTYCSRMGTSVLSNLGLEELIAQESRRVREDRGGVGQRSAASGGAAKGSAGADANFAGDGRGRVHAGNGGGLSRDVATAGRVPSTTCVGVIFAPDTSSVCLIAAIAGKPGAEMWYNMRKDVMPSSRRRL